MNKELITALNPKSIISESIKTIRTNLLFTSVDEGLKTIVVTSSIPGEGKSFIASNLAVAFAQSKYSVLLVDCDMRKGRLHRMFGLTNEKGLSDMLIAEMPDLREYIKNTKIDSLNLITMGTTPPNPLELLSSAKFNDFLEIVKSKYDIVILDSTPINAVSDALVLSKIVDQTVIVASQRKTDVKDLINTKKAILNAGGTIAGVVLNQKKTKKKDYYGKYYR